MSSIDWVPELASALDELVPLEAGSRADWEDVVARAGRRRQLWLARSRPRRRLRLVLVVALLFLLLTGVATATYLLVRGNGGIALGDGSVRLLVVDPNGPGLRVVARCPAASRHCAIGSPAFSPDGRRLAFIRGRAGGMTKPSHMFVYVAAASGGGAQRLVSCGGCIGQLAWSPNGRWIAFTRDAKRENSIWVVAAAGGNTHQVTASHAPCSDEQQTWSPDGRRLVFVHATPTPGGNGIYTVRPNGSDKRKIATTAGWALPQWSPDGRRIVFDKRDGIAVMNADGSHVHELNAAAGPNGPGAPSWSPDGRKLVFFNTPFNTPRRRGGYRAEVWTMNADGSGKERLYRSGCCVGYWAPPVWSPDGRLIAFSADSAGGTFVINADGTGLRRLSTIVSDSLSWQRLPKGEPK
jgi:Tol biopolymer transport system component